jgi:hypothetical protein
MRRSSVNNTAWILLVTPSVLSRNWRRLETRGIPHSSHSDNVLLNETTHYPLPFRPQVPLSPQSDCLLFPRGPRSVRAEQCYVPSRTIAVQLEITLSVEYFCS